MSDFPTGREPGSIAPVPPLTFRTEEGEGELYKRTASVEARLGWIWTLHSAQWLEVAPGEENECIVHMIVHSRDRDPELMGRLMLLLGKRIYRLARSRIPNKFGKATAEDIIKGVEDHIFDVLLAPTPSLNSEFLEVAFAETVLKRTFNAIRNHLRTPAGHRAELPAGATDQDEDTPERQFNLLPSRAPNPEKTCIQADSIDKARQSVKDPTQWEAIDLHHREGMPIVSSDPKQVDLMRHQGASEWTVKYRIRAGLKAIRKAFGDKDEQK
jgi:hypothetical protein